MNPSHPTGLGEPEPAGKMTLFQPPKIIEKPKPITTRKAAAPKPTTHLPPEDLPRIRTTIDLTQEALKVIQSIQQEHRLQSGKVLTLWKAVSQAIEYYGQKKGKQSG